MAYAEAFRVEHQSFKPVLVPRQLGFLPPALKDFPALSHVIALLYLYQDTADVPAFQKALHEIRTWLLEAIRTRKINWTDPVSTENVSIRTKAFFVLLCLIDPKNTALRSKLTHLFLYAN